MIRFRCTPSLRISACVLGALLVLLDAASGLVSARISYAQARPVRLLRGLNVVPGRVWTTVEIHLGAAARVVAHSPSEKGRVLEIRLRAEPPGEFGADFSGREVLEWRERDLVGLVDVTLDGDSAGSPRLELHFTERVEFEVSQGSDLEVIRVAVRRIVETSAVRPEASGGDDVMDQIMVEGRRAMTSRDYGRAILLFRKVMQEEGHPRAPEARELLGLAHQRKGQLAHARAVYEEYLQRYPEGEGAGRVRQRLQALLTSTQARKKAAPRPKLDQAFTHSFNGSLSQYYRTNILDTDPTGTETSNSAVDSDVFLTSRHRRGGFSMRTNFSGSYRYDALGELDSSDAARLTTAFIDTNWSEGQHSLRLGRQSASGGGILGRFDGMVLSTQIAKSARISLSSGYPVDFTDSNRINSDRPFYGVNIESGTFAKYWDGQVYGIQQWLHGLEDRTAVGGQLRFSHQRGFGLALVDYDTSYETLNTAMLIANWRATDRTSANLLVDIRASPILTTFNALQGQLVGGFEDLKDVLGLTEREIRDLAEDRMSRSRLVTLGGSHQLNETWQISADMTVSDLTDTDASGGVAATEGTGTEYFYSVRSSASNLLLEGSFTTFDLRYADTSTGDRYSFGASARYPIMDGLRIGPQATVEYRTIDGADEILRYRPGIRIDYRWRKFSFEFDGGVEVSDGSANSGAGDQTEYFFSLGYRYSF